MEKGPTSSVRVFCEDFVAGGTAAAIGKTACAPLERSSLLLSRPAKPVNVGLFKESMATLSVLRKSIELGGLSSLWQGNLRNVLRVAPNLAFTFAFMDYFKRTIQSNDAAKSRSLDSYISGGLAGGMVNIIHHPLHVAKARVAMGKVRSKGLVDYFSQTTRKKGFGALFAWRGLALSMPSAVIYRGLFFGLYDTGVSAASLNGEASTLTTLLVAFVGTLASALAVRPFDAVRSRLARDQEMRLLLAVRNVGRDWHKLLQPTGRPFTALNGALALVLYGQVQCSTLLRRRVSDLA